MSSPSSHEMDDRAGLYLEDLHVGQCFSGQDRVTVEPERVKSFAEEFDPQPFHLNECAAQNSIFGALAASGWHTAAITMRLLVAGAFKPAGGIVGAGFTELKWPRPVRPGDELRVETEVLEVRPSKSRPTQGIVTTRTSTFNQRNEVVQVSVGQVIVQRRPQRTLTSQEWAEG